MTRFVLTPCKVGEALWREAMAVDGRVHFVNDCRRGRCGGIEIAA